MLASFVVHSSQNMSRARGPHLGVVSSSLSALSTHRQEVLGTRGLPPSRGELLLGGGPLASGGVGGGGEGGKAVQTEAGPSGSPAHPLRLRTGRALSPGHTEGPALSRCWPTRLGKM